MDRIENRAQLICFIRDNIRQRAIGAACHSGTVQVLGGFSSIPPADRPGWIVSITSACGQAWLVAVIAYDHEHIFRVRTIDEIPWWTYDGKDEPGYSIFNGDNPVAACRARKEADAQSQCT